MRQTFDRRSVLGIAVGGAAGAVMLASARPSHAAAMNFKADLKGASEVPPTTSTGTGTATVTYDASTKTVTWQGSFSGLSGPATAAHIHGPGRGWQECRRHRAAVAEGHSLHEPVQGLGDIAR